MLLPAIIVGIFFGVVAAVIARYKGRNEFVWFVVGFLFQIIGLIVVFFPPVVKMGVNKLCPRCAEIVKANATLCKHCHSPLDVYYEAKVVSQ